MKRFVILGSVVAVLLILLLFVWLRDRNTASSTPETLVTTIQTHAPANPSRSVGAKALQPKSNVEDTGSIALVTNRNNEFEQRVRRSTEAANLPVAFYGLVVDQDSNVLQNVSVDLAVVEERVDSFPQHNQRITPLQRQTGADGRFEVIGSDLKGRMLGVSMLTKAGYEQEFPGQTCGTFGTQSTSFYNPGVLKMWSTNLHEPLVTGEKSFVVIPDGRHYAIDLMKATITEGETGDLVVWIKRPETVARRERYAWSCELSIPSGGLLESESQAMFRAPEVGYTNAFTYQQEADPNRWGDGTGDKRFYVRLRSGQVYGRIVVHLYAGYNGKPASVRLSYAINPSGSCLLR